MACLLTWAQDTALAIAAKYVEAGVKLVINQFRYMCCLRKFQEQLDQQEKEFKVTQAMMKRKVEEGEDNNEAANEPVADWMDRANKALQDADFLQNTIQQDNRCLSNCCPNYFWRYSRSKEAEDLTTTLRNLKQEQSQFQNFSHKVKPLNPEFILSDKFMDSEASQSALDSILTALETDDVCIIGLHGMPGSGKTTLAIKAKGQAEEGELFEEFVKVTLSQKPDIKEIQEQIAAQLRLEFNRSSRQERAGELLLRFQDKKRKLIVLDDIWGKINLAEIGIAYSNNCKILVTTRRLQVCQSMDCQAIVELGLLTEEEAWSLFKQSAHLNDDSSSLIGDAMKVVKECRRLPLAVVSVGHALKDKLDPSDWQLALIKLQKYDYPKLRGVEEDENVYRCLQLSVDYLNSEATKRILLLCSLYPEDYIILAEDLARYAFGLRLFEEAESVKEVMLEVLGSLNELKDSHLLLETETAGHAKMHDLVRAVAIWIGKSYVIVKDNEMDKEFKMGNGIRFKEWPSDGRFNSFGAISLLKNEIEDLPDRLDCPRLEMLLLERDDDHRTNIPLSAFEISKRLEVLSVTRGVLSLRSLECLRNLRTLKLNDCIINLIENRMDLASLRNLKRLEILSFVYCGVRQLPNEIGELQNLKLLEIADFEQIDEIPSDVIRRLRKLEELHIGKFKNWEIVRTGNANLMELKSLHHLSVLSLTYPKDIPQSFAFSNHMIGYYLHLYCSCTSPSTKLRLRYPTTRRICFTVTEANVRACKELFRNVHDLRIRRNNTSFKNMLPDMSRAGFQELSVLDISDCEMECLISTKNQIVATANAFSNLEKLKIEGTTMTEICNGEPPQAFLNKLQVLQILNCDDMITILPAKLSQAMKNLEHVEVSHCENLQQVFQLDEINEENQEEFLLHLGELVLNQLPNVRRIWNGPTHHISLKRLTYLLVEDCRSLTSLLTPSLAESMVHLEQISIRGCPQLKHIIPEKDEEGKGAYKQPYLQYLKSVEISSCNGLQYIFPVSVAPGLLRLQMLTASSCNQLKQVFSGYGGPKVLSADSNDMCAPSKTFQKLATFSRFSMTRKFNMEDLSRVGYIFSMNYDVVLPSLCRVEIRECPKLSMQSFVRVTPKASTDSEQLAIANPTEIPLETLDLKGCLELEQIIAKKVEKDIGTSLNTSFLLLSFTHLQKILIANCNKMKILLPMTIAQYLPCLTELYIKSCSKLMAVFDCEDQADIKNTKIRFPMLLKLYLEDLPSLISLFPEGYEFLFPSLEEFTVMHCLMIKEIFGSKIKGEGDAIDKKEILEFPKLLRLYLEELPSLIRFCPMRYGINFQSIKEFIVERCPVMTTNFPIAPVASTHTKTEEHRKRARHALQHEPRSSDADELSQTNDPSGRQTYGIIAAGPPPLRKRTSRESDEDEKANADGFKASCSSGTGLNEMKRERGTARGRGRGRERGRDSAQQRSSHINETNPASQRSTDVKKKVSAQQRGSTAHKTNPTQQRNSGINKAKGKEKTATRQPWK